MKRLPYAVMLVVVLAAIGCGSKKSTPVAVVPPAPPAPVATTPPMTTVQPGVAPNLPTTVTPVAPPTQIVIPSVAPTTRPAPPPTVVQPAVTPPATTPAVENPPATTTPVEPPATIPPATTPTEPPAATPATNPAPGPDEEVVKADVGVGIKGRSLDQYEGAVVTPAKAFFAVREKAVFQIQIPHAMQLFEAENGFTPKTHEEFMEKIVMANGIKLPELPVDAKYVYNVEEKELQVVRKRKQ